jgi:hypothetical protein
MEGREVPIPKTHLKQEEERKKMEKSQQIKERSMQKKMDRF